MKGLTAVGVTVIEGRQVAGSRRIVHLASTDKERAMGCSEERRSCVA